MLVLGVVSARIDEVFQDRILVFAYQLVAWPLWLIEFPFSNHEKQGGGVLDDCGIVLINIHIYRDLQVLISLIF